MFIKEVRLIDPATRRDEIISVRIENGKFKEWSKNLEEKPGEEIIFGQGLILSPGFVDSHVHFRDPGQTEKEDIISGSKAAAAGGYTSVICMANTAPVLDNPRALEYFMEKRKKSPIHVHTVGALTKKFNDRELTDMDLLKEKGVVAFSDDGLPNADAKILRKGLLKAKELGLTVSLHEEDPDFVHQQGIHSMDGEHKGAERVAEDLYIARDGVLALETGARIVVQHLSSGRAVSLIRSFQDLGADIHAEVTPHHFSATRDLVEKKGTLAKCNPPLREESDRQQILEGLQDGTISIIATDHAPHTKEEKEREFAKAPSGMIGLETALGLGITHLVETGILTITELLEKMTINPAKIFGLSAGRVELGGVADFTLIDPEREWTVENFASKAANSPFIGEKLKGKVMATFVNGKDIYRDPRIVIHKEIVKEEITEVERNLEEIYG